MPSDPRHIVTAPSIASYDLEPSIACMKSSTRRHPRRWAVILCGMSAATAPVTPGMAQANSPRDIESQTIPGTEVSFAFAFVPGGSFLLGSPADEVGRHEDEGPQRQVFIDAFWMGTTEVTYDMYAVFRDPRLDNHEGATTGLRFDVDAVTRPSPPYEDPSHGMSGPGYPATGMTRLAALRFARWLSLKTGRLYRLPTEAEWEFACRAGSEGTVETDLLDRTAWYEANSGGAIHEVGAKAPNALGIHDLWGNVAEWTLDPYVADFYASIPNDGSATSPTTGPSSRGRGVVRGGAFDDNAQGLRCADRFEEPSAWKRRDPQIPKSRWWNTDSPHVGFRLVTPEALHTPEQIRAYWDHMLGTR